MELMCLKFIDALSGSQYKNISIGWWQNLFRKRKGERRTEDRKVIIRIGTALVVCLLYNCDMVEHISLLHSITVSSDGETHTEKNIHEKQCGNNVFSFQMRMSMSF